MKKIYAVATESDVVLAFESRSDADEYAGEHDGMARALCPECAESLRAWFLAGAAKPEGRE